MSDPSAASAAPNEPPPPDETSEERYKRFVNAPMTETGQRCQAMKNCNSGQTDNFRKAISHVFGRNKRCTRTIPNEIWVPFCRKHYQRSRYRDVQEYVGLQFDLILAQLERAQIWSDRSVRDGKSDFLKGWTLALRKREQDRVHGMSSKRRRVEDGNNAHDDSVLMNQNQDGDNDEDEDDDDDDNDFPMDKAEAAGIAVPKWLRDLCGIMFQTEDVKTVIQRLKDEALQNGWMNIPDIEILADFSSGETEDPKPRQTRNTKKEHLRWRSQSSASAFQRTSSGSQIHSIFGVPGIPGAPRPEIRRQSYAMEGYKIPRYNQSSHSRDGPILAPPTPRTSGRDLPLPALPPTTTSGQDLPLPALTPTTASEQDLPLPSPTPTTRGHDLSTPSLAPTTRGHDLSMPSLAPTSRGHDHSMPSLAPTTRGQDLPLPSPTPTTQEHDLPMPSLLPTIQGHDFPIPWRPQTPRGPDLSLPPRPPMPQRLGFSLPRRPSRQGQTGGASVPYRPGPDYMYPQSQYGYVPQQYYTVAQGTYQLPVATSSPRHYRNLSTPTAHVSLPRPYYNEIQDYYVQDSERQQHRGRNDHRSISLQNPSQWQERSRPAPLNVLRAEKTEWQERIRQISQNSLASEVSRPAPMLQSTQQAEKTKDPYSSRRQGK